MSDSEQNRLSSFLFDSTDIEVLDIKFLRGRNPDLTVAELCATAEGVLKDFFASSLPGELPKGRTLQQNVADIL